MSLWGQSFPTAISALCLVCLSEPNRNRVFNKQPVHPRADFIFYQQPHRHPDSWTDPYTLHFTRVTRAKSGFVTNPEGPLQLRGHGPPPTPLSLVHSPTHSLVPPTHTETQSSVAHSCQLTHL